MKALLDEHLPVAIAKMLCDRGYDVMAVTERPDWVGLRDTAVIEVARAERRAIVTSNLRDFRPLAAQAMTSGRGHAGMIFVPTTFRRRRKDAARLASAIEAVMRHSPDGLANQERWLE